MIEPTRKRFAHRVSDGVIIGATAGLTIIFSIVLLSAFLNNKQQETLDAIRAATEASQIAAERNAGANACSLAAPIQQEEKPDGTVVSTRPEGFVNRVCLAANGFDPIDLNGDGTIEGGGP